MAVDLNIFDALAGSQGQGQGKTASQLGDELNLKQDRVDRFLRALVSLGLLELRDDGNILGIEGLSNTISYLECSCDHA